jgi:hypothetical protein
LVEETISPCQPSSELIEARRKGSSSNQERYRYGSQCTKRDTTLRAFQLVAAWRLTGLDNPECLESVGVWFDRGGNPKGRCRWGYREPLSFRYQAIISAAGPVAEAQIRQAERYDCLTAGEDYEIMMRSVRRGLVTVDEALNEATFIFPV